MVGGGVATRFAGGGLSDDEGDASTAAPPFPGAWAELPLAPGTLSVVPAEGGFVPPSAVEAGGVGAAAASPTERETGDGSAVGGAASDTGLAVPARRSSGSSSSRLRLRSDIAVQASVCGGVEERAAVGRLASQGAKNAA